MRHQQLARRPLFADNWGAPQPCIFRWARMIKFKCPKCEKLLKAPHGTEGRAATCRCGAAVIVPNITPAESNPFAFEAKSMEPPSGPNSNARQITRIDRHYDDERNDDRDDDRPRKKFRRGQFSCPYCATDRPPRMREEISGIGWGVMVAMLFICFPLFFIGLLIKNRYRECAECGVRIGG